MKVRRYFAVNTRTALKMVRHEEGSDVLILSNRKVDGGVELITGSGEVDTALVKRFATTTKETSRTTDPKAVPRVEAATSSAPNELPTHPEGLWTNPQTLAQMQRELTGIKDLLEQQLSGFAWHDFRARHPTRSRVLRGLTQLGVAPQLGGKLVAEIGDSADYDAAWHAVMCVIEARLQVLDDPILRRGGHVALCGPTGVGKTTLASKLAARYALTHGAQEVALISTDDQRLGAHHQLRTFGRLLGIQVEAVTSFEALPERLAEVSNKALVIIDLPGFAPHTPEFRESLIALYGLPDPVQCYLVAAATTDYLSLSRLVAPLAGLNLVGCCLTKLDEAAVLGPALSLLLESALPLAYITAGQQVPDDLESVSKRAFLQRVLTGAERRTEPVPSAILEQAFARKEHV